MEELRFPADAHFVDRPGPGRGNSIGQTPRARRQQVGHQGLRPVLAMCQVERVADLVHQHGQQIGPAECRSSVGGQLRRTGANQELLIVVRDRVQKPAVSCRVFINQDRVTGRAAQQVVGWERAAKQVVGQVRHLDVDSVQQIDLLWRQARRTPTLDRFVEQWGHIRYGERRCSGAHSVGRDQMAGVRTNRLKRGGTGVTNRV